MSQFIEMFGNQNTNDKQWTESLVKDEFKLSMGKTPARSNPKCWENGTHRWISISDMATYTRYTVDTSEYITDYAITDSGIKVVPKGTIIMSFKLSIGRTAITSEDIYTNEAIMAFADFDEKKFNIDFLHFLIANKNWLLGAKQAVKGQTLNKESIGNAKIIIPPIEMQEEFASIYNQADKSEFVGFKSQFIEMFYNGKYTVDKLREHIDVIRGVSYKPSDVYETHNENTSIVLRSNNIEGGQINFDDLVYVSTERVSELQLLRVGDIVMCGSNGSKKLVGKAAMLQETPTIRTSFGAFCLGIRCKPTLVPEYLATYFQTSLYRDEIEQLGSGSNILNIKPDHIYDLEVPIPLYDEQMAFVSIVRQADKSEFELRKSIEAIDQVIKSLINN